MHRVVVRYAASRRRTQGSVRTVAVTHGADETNRIRDTGMVRNAQDILWEDVVPVAKATTAGRRVDARRNVWRIAKALNELER